MSDTIFAIILLPKPPRTTGGPWWNVIDKWKAKNSEKNLPQCHVSTINPTRTDPCANTCLHGERLATKCLSYGMAWLPWLLWLFWLKVNIEFWWKLQDTLAMHTYSNFFNDHCRLHVKCRQFTFYWVSDISRPNLLTVYCRPWNYNCSDSRQLELFTVGATTVRSVVPWAATRYMGYPSLN
jgi:hypothetical protein